MRERRGRMRQPRFDLRMFLWGLVFGAVVAIPFALSTGNQLARWTIIAIMGVVMGFAFTYRPLERRDSPNLTVTVITGIVVAAVGGLWLWYVRG